MANTTTLSTEITETLSKGKHGCALCSLWVKEEDSLVAKIKREGAPTNSEMRDKIIAASGFCNRHTHLIHKQAETKTDDAFGGSASAQLVLKKIEDDLTSLLAEVKGEKGGTTEAGFGKDRFNGMMNKLEKTLYGDSICPVCDRLLRSDKDRLASLLQMLESKELADLYVKSDALCMPHYVSAMRLLPSASLKNREAVWSLLVKTQLSRLGSVDNLLEERMKKYSWDFRDEAITPEEAGAQKTGMVLISGVEGLYSRPRKTSLRPAREP